MKTVYLHQLEPFFKAVAQRMDLYVPQDIGGHEVIRLYDPSTSSLPPNAIRACTPLKEKLFPLREIAAVFPEPVEPEAVKPFAVFGLKDCDLRSLDILDRVFLEDEFVDPLYQSRRDTMLVMATDCYEPAESCFCNVMHGEPFATEGFDLNLSPVGDGTICEIGSDKGEELVRSLSDLFDDVSAEAVQQRDEKRVLAEQKLQEQNSGLQLDGPLEDMMEAGFDAGVFKEQAATCVECQACTRVCPTCHCFYLFDEQKETYFNKMKMWDSCMRLSYAQVAGGGNPRPTLAERLRHRLMHKFSYFVQRYGIDMCVGCGRCVDAEAGAVDIRVVMKRINEEFGKQTSVPA